LSLLTSEKWHLIQRELPLLTSSLFAITIFIMTIDCHYDSHSCYNGIQRLWTSWSCMW
jgi:hypothetical protein